MEITTAFTEASLRELSRANRNWPYWPVHFVGGSMRIAALLLGVVLFAIRCLYLGFSTSPLDGDNLPTGFVLLALVAILIVFLTYRERSNLRKMALSQQTLHITIDEAGFLTRSPGTQPERLAWAQLSGFSAGTHIVFLWLKQSRKKATAIPIDTLSPLQSGQLRSILLAHFPEKPQS